jgi:pyruvate kinase
VTSAALRRTRIVCTIGPASSSEAVLDRLVAAGMDVARLNFSHGTQAEHAEVIRRIRAGEERWGRPVAILQDLQGPKARLATFAGGHAELESGASFTIMARPVDGDARRASINYPEYLRAVKAGDEIWIDDGMVQLRVEAVSADEVRCRVIAGGVVSDHKGLALPRVPIPASSLTEKDRDDLRFGIGAGVDFVAISFVRSAADVEEVRRFLREHGSDVPLVAKLERAEVLANLPAIFALVDAVMVARGDLGMEVPIEEVPLIQKEIIRQARAARRPAIVATQMLESMTAHRRPTRAEVSDVATAIFDGADAIMLSAETATGRYPAETVEVMARIAERAERAVLPSEVRRRRQEVAGFTEAVADAARYAARDLQAKAIVTFTRSGASARFMSQQRPEAPIIALTTSPEVRRRLSLCWGVTSRLCRKVETTEEMLDEVDATLLRDGTAQVGDTLVIVSGAPMWVAGTTNLLKLHRVGERR